MKHPDGSWLRRNGFPATARRMSALREAAISAAEIALDSGLSSLERVRTSLGDRGISQSLVVHAPLDDVEAAISSAMRDPAVVSWSSTFNRHERPNRQALSWHLGRGRVGTAFHAELTATPQSYRDAAGIEKTGTLLILVTVAPDPIRHGWERAARSGAWLGRVGATAEGIAYTPSYQANRSGTIGPIS